MENTNLENETPTVPCLEYCHRNAT